MHRYLIALLLVACGAARAAVPTCPVTVGTITLNPIVTRVSGVSPLFVFLDATNTTDTSITGNFSVFQRGAFTWNFSDPGPASGQGIWRFGSGSGYQSKNIATGAIAGHLYQTNGADTPYTPILTYVNPSGVKAACKLTNAFTAFDPNGANGYPGTKTTCVSASGTPVAGSGGCPAGAAVLQTSLLATALGTSHLTTNSRVLFKCGDTFTGHNVPIGAITNFSVGAYGSPDCSNTQTNRPMFQFSGTADGGSGVIAIGIANAVPGDGRWLDFDMAQPVAHAAQWCWGMIGTAKVPYQQTLVNLNCSNANSNYQWAQGAQMALINSVGVNQQNAIGTFINSNGNGTGIWVGLGTIPNINYQALIGNSLSGSGDTGNEGDEAVRISASLYLIIENNHFFDGNSIGAALKVFESNNPNGTAGSQLNFAGIPGQFIEISDNLFDGHSGAQLVEISPQNTCVDERFFDVVVERNLFREQFDQFGTFLLLSGERETVRNNVFFVASGFVHPSFVNNQIAGRTGVTGGGCSPNPSAVQTTQFTEVYNNTYHSLSFRAPQCGICLDSSFSGLGGNSGQNSNVACNLYYSPAGVSGLSVIDNAGANNIIGTNTSNAGAANNPAIKNFSGAFSKMSDFKPTANFSGCTTMPGVLTDAMGLNRSGTVDLGAVTH